MILGEVDFTMKSTLFFYIGMLISWWSPPISTSLLGGNLIILDTMPGQCFIFSLDNDGMAIVWMKPVDLRDHSGLDPLMLGVFC